jgi:nucleoside-diphosphate-sugar epimerase
MQIALSLSASVVALTRSPEQFCKKAPHLVNDSAVRLLPGDIREFEFPKEDCHYLFHAAADTSTQATERPALLLSSIRDGTPRVLEFAATQGSAVCCSSVPERYRHAAT